MLPEDFTDKLVALDQNTSVYFIKLQNNYEDGLKQNDFQSLKISLDIMLKWDSLIIKLRRTTQMYNSNDKLLNNMKKAISDLKDYSHMLDSVSEKIQGVKNEIISQELINDKTEKFSEDRDRFYKALNEKTSSSRKSYGTL